MSRKSKSSDRKEKLKYVDEEATEDAKKEFLELLEVNFNL